VVGGCNSTYTRTAGEPKGSTPVSVATIIEKKEKEEEPFDPVKAHMKAREMVDPSDTRPEHQYTKKHLSKEALGPDTEIVLRKKPTEMERAEALRLAEIRQKSWFSTFFASNDDEEEQGQEQEEQAEDFEVAAVDPKDKKDKEGKQENQELDDKVEPEDKQDVTKKPEEPVVKEVKTVEAKPPKEAEKKIEKKEAPKKEAPKKEAAPTKKEPDITVKSADAKQEAKPDTKHKVVTNVRIGDHPNKTRMVIDMTNAPKFTYQVQDDKNLLVVNLPDTDWDAKDRKVYAHHPLILAYIAKKSPEGGTILAFKLRKKIKVLKDTVFRPSENAGHRIVFDIAEG